MRILMLTSRFGSGYGMGYSAWKEACSLADLGHSITVVHCNPDVASYADDRITLIHLPIPKRRFVDFIIFRRSLRQLFSKTVQPADYDIMYIQSLEFGLIDFSLIPIPVYYFARSTMSGLYTSISNTIKPWSLLRKINNRILIGLEQRCMDSSRKVLVKSKLMVEEVSRFYHIPQKRIIEVRGGIDSADFKIMPTAQRERLKQNLGLPNDAYIFLYAGRIVPQKGLLILIKAAQALSSSKNFALIIAGDHMETAYGRMVRQAIAQSSCPEKFFILDHIDQKEIFAIFNIADCIVTPSLYEPFGMVNLQAACLGKRIITTEAVGSVDILINYPGLAVVRTASVEALKGSLRARLKESSESLVPFASASLSWVSVAQQLETCFTDKK